MLHYNTGKHKGFQMRNWALLLLPFTMLFMVGCSKQPKIKEKIVYKTQYIYLPCKQTQPLASIPSQSKSPKKAVAKKPVTKRTRFILPKKSVKFFAPKRYITRPNQKMNFMVGYNSDGTAFLYLEGEFNTNTYKNFLKYIHESACLLYTSPSPRDGLKSRMPSYA